MGSELSSPKAGQDVVKREGWLTKKGGWRNTGTKRHHIKSWKKRYFVLWNEQLSYYASKSAFHKHLKPMGTLSLNPDSAVRDGEEYRHMQMDLKGKSLTGKMKRKLKISRVKHELVVCGFEGNLMLRADTKRAKEQWLVDIRTIIAGIKVTKSSSFQNLLISFSRNSGEKKLESSSADDTKTLTNVEVIKEENEEANSSSSRNRRSRNDSSEERNNAEMLTLEELVVKLLCSRPGKSDIAGRSWHEFLIHTHVVFSESHGINHTSRSLAPLLIKTCVFFPVVILLPLPEVARSHKGKFQEIVIHLLEKWLDEASDDIENVDASIFETATLTIHEDCQERYCPTNASSFLFYDVDKTESLSLEPTSSSSTLRRPKANGESRRETVRRVTVNEKKLGYFFKKFCPEIMDIRNYDVEQVCDTLMHVDHNLIKSISPRSFMKKLWKNKNAGFLCPDLMHAIATWNKRCYWVATAILNDDLGKNGTVNLFAKKCKEFIKQFIDIGCACVQRGNFYCASCIICALKLQCVKRFKPAWDLLSKHSRKNMEFLEEACSRKSYWDRFGKAQREDEIHIPHLPLYLDALYQIEVKFCKDKHGKINLTKYKRQWDLISGVIKTQKHAEHTGDKDDELVSALSSAVHWAFTEEKLYAISYKYLPRSQTQASS
eukprot:jgi/Bigna1/74300/fgenesh1_pg.28_\